jgi:hypothetical protein
MFGSYWVFLIPPFFFFVFLGLRDFFVLGLGLANSWMLAYLLLLA